MATAPHKSPFDFHCTRLWRIVETELLQQQQQSDRARFAWSDLVVRVRTRIHRTISSARIHTMLNGCKNEEIYGNMRTQKMDSFFLNRTLMHLIFKLKKKEHRNLQLTKMPKTHSTKERERYDH